MEKSRPKANPFQVILGKEFQANKGLKDDTFTSIQTLFLFICSINTRLLYFISRLTNQKDDVIDAVRKGNAEVLKRYCQVTLSTGLSISTDTAKLIECIDRFDSNLPRDLHTANAEQTKWYMFFFYKQNQTELLTQYIINITGLFKTCLRSVIFSINSNITTPLREISSDSHFEKISRKLGTIQRSTISAIEMLTDEMNRSLSFIGCQNFEKWSCVNDFLVDHKLEPHQSLSHPRPKIWLCSDCWQWNEDKVLFSDMDQSVYTESAICKHCFTPILCNTRDVQNLHIAMKYGSIEYHVRTSIVQGEARVGKTCVKSLLLSQPYESLSTNCIETPVIGTFSVERYSANSSTSTTNNEGRECWTAIEEKEMTEKIMAELQMAAKRDLRESLPMKEYISTDKFLASDDKGVGLKKIDMSEASQKATTPTTSTEKERGSSDSSNSAMQFYEPVYDEKQEVKRLGEHRDWLYLIDSGGQIQFQKLLPAFMPFVSVLILVINVSKSLSDFSSTSMQLTNEVISVDKHSLKVKEVLKQLLLAIVSASNRHALDNHDLLQYVDVPPKEMNVIAIATHCDKYEELLKEGNEIETVEMKEEILMDIFRPIKNSCKLIYQDPDARKLFHVVDGRKAERGEYDDPVIAQISSKLKDQAYKIKVPLKWHCFGNSLHKEASNGCGVMSLSQCKDIGNKLYMSPDEVVTCLKFLHMLNMLFYYPDSPAKDIVFVELESLIDIIRDLMVMVSRDRPTWTRAPSEVMDFVTEGTISINILKKSGKCAKISQVFGNFESLLLGVFEHLLIAVPLHGEDRFLMPAILPAKDVSDIKPFPSSPPLLFYFENSVPIGLFCATVVNLLSLKRNGQNTWRIIRSDDNYSNHLLIAKKGMEESIVLVEGLDYFEVHAKEPAFLVTDDITNAIDYTVRKRKLIKLESIPKAFHCPCSVMPAHVAIVEGDEEKGLDIAFQCILTKRTVDINGGRRWFRTGTKGLLPFDIKEKLSKEHAPPILTAIKDLVSEWQIVGTFLDIEDRVLRTIDLECRGAVADCRRQMIISWLQQENATREKLIEALDNVGRHDIATVVKKL